MDCKIQTCHILIASRFLRGFCNFSHEKYWGKTVICKIVQSECRAALSLCHVEGSSGTDTFPVSEGREHGKKDKSLKVVCCLCAAQMAAETKSVCGRLRRFSWLNSLFWNWVGK